VGLIGLNRKERAELAAIVFRSRSSVRAGTPRRDQDREISFSVAPLPSRERRAPARLQQAAEVGLGAPGRAPAGSHVAMGCQLATRCFITMHCVSEQDRLGAGGRMSARSAVPWQSHSRLAFGQAGGSSTLCGGVAERRCRPRACLWASVRPGQSEPRAMATRDHSTAERGATALARSRSRRAVQAGKSMQQHVNVGRRRQTPRKTKRAGA